MLLILLFVAPIAIYLFSALVGTLSVTLGAFIFTMGWSFIASFLIGPWAFLIGFVWFVAVCCYQPAISNE